MSKVGEGIFLADDAYRLAKEYERTCTGCAQSVVAGFLDALGLEEGL